MSGRPLVWFTVCWVLGSGVAAAQPMSGIVMAGSSLFALLLALAFLRRSSWVLAAACLAAFSAAAGQRIWADARNVTSLPAQYADALEASPGDRAEFEVKLTGIIVSPPDIDGDRVQFLVAGSSVQLRAGTHKPASTELRGERYLVQVKLAEEQELDEAAGWQRGEKAVINGVLSIPSSSTNFGGFDYRAYLKGQRIHWLLGAAGAGAVHVESGPRWTTASLLQRMDALRARLGQEMDELYPGVGGGYMKGLILGMREDLDPGVFRQFSQLGLTHILAISGLHVAVFLYVLSGLLRLLRMTRERMLVIMMVAVPFYVFLSGAAPSVMRAGIMCVLGLAAARLNKLRDGLHLLAAAALLMLAWDPYFLGNVGFQLSFLVTAGLILGTSPIRKLLPRGKGRLTSSIFDLLSVSLVAQAVSLPLTIYYFNQLHVLSLAANLILVPFISFIVMPLGGASLILGGIWHPAGATIAKVASIGNELTFGIVMKLSGLKSFRLIWATPSLWWVVFYYAALGLLLYTLHQLHRGKEASEDSAQNAKLANSPADENTQPLQQELRPSLDSSSLSYDSNGRLPLDSGPSQWSAAFIEVPSASAMSTRWRRMAPVLACMVLAGMLFGAYFPNILNRDGYVDFLDVGQGDAIFIETPGGKHVLIDGGGAVTFGKQKDGWRKRKDPYEVGRKTVLPLLQRRGAHEIDLLVLSHLDSDHIKGLLAIIEAIPIRAILWNGTVKSSTDAITLLRTAVVDHIPLYQAEGGREWKMDSSTSIEVIGTPPALVHHQASLSLQDAAQMQEQGSASGGGKPGKEQQEVYIPEVKEQNGESVALLLTMNGRRFLLTGDADAAEERSLLSQLQETQALQGVQADEGIRWNPAALSAITSSSSSSSSLTKQIDVMKLSHHGSKTSTTWEWIAYWKPAQAVISVGRNNSYGHPHPTVMERLRNADIPVARTDQDGEVQFRVKQNGTLYQRKVIP